MQYVDEFRDERLIRPLIQKIREYKGRNYTFMEVCGGHTMAIHRFGLPSLIPSNIRLISGPGCPVCVTGKSFIDKAITLSKVKGFIITTYGDLMRVPGTVSSLGQELSDGRDIRIVISPLEALEIARREPGRKVIFIGIGFETTAPGSAVAILEAAERGITNFFLLSGHKIMPPAMEAILTGGVALDGFICPGHVSTITGSSIFDFIAGKYHLPCVVAGFEPTDILQSVGMLLHQVETGTPSVEIQYRRAVTVQGNLKAKEYLTEVFDLTGDEWRGLGIIPQSGYKLRNKFAAWDAESNFPLESTDPEVDSFCICGDILRGLRNPPDCKYFATECDPVNPVGACMVSPEGACHIYFRYNRNDRSHFTE